MSLELVIVGDSAWTPEEWEAEQKRRERGRAWNRAYGQRPEVKARKAAYFREWRARNLDEYRAYQRDYKRAAYHANNPRLVGSLHDLACAGPTIPTGCICARRGTAKIRCYDKPR